MLNLAQQKFPSNQWSDSALFVAGGTSIIKLSYM